MLLSNQTHEGLQITSKHNSENLLLHLCSQVYTNLFLSVNSFVEMKAFFGKQRAAGGQSDNPTVRQFCFNTVSLRVQGSAALEPVRWALGNHSRFLNCWHLCHSTVHFDKNSMLRIPRSFW